MPITEKTRKILWGKSGNRCAICKCLLQSELDNSKKISVIGDECHIVARGEQGPRFDSKLPKRKIDQYTNLILLCKIHHKIIDDHPETYKKDLFFKIKDEHEEWVRRKLDPSNDKSQSDDTVFKNNVKVYLKNLLNAYSYVVFPLYELGNKILIKSYIPVELLQIHKENLKTDLHDQIEIPDKNGKYENTINSNSLLDILENKSNLLINGSPGSGKSTLLKCVVFNCSKKYSNSLANGLAIPIFVELKWFNGELISLIIEALNKNGFNCTEQNINAILSREPILFLFDGLDEASDPEKCVTQIKNLIGKFKKSNVIITTRAVFLNKLFIELGFDILEVKPLSKRLINQFLRNILNEKETNKINLYFEKFGLLNEIRNPLMLILFVYEYITVKNKLSVNKTQLFKSVIENHYLLSWNIKKLSKQYDAELLVEDQIKFLSFIAYSMIENDDDYNTDNSDYTDIGKNSKITETYKLHCSEDEILNSLLMNNLLVKKGNRISFSHKSFQYYFASKHLLELYKRSSKRFISKYFFTKWEEVIIFFAGHLENPSHFISRIIVPWHKYMLQNTKNVSLRLLFASKCIGNIKVYDKNTDVLVEQAIKIISIWDEDSNYRFKKLQFLLFPIVFKTELAFDLLSQIRSEKVANYLLEYLKKRYNNDNYADLYAVRALSAMEQSEEILGVICKTAIFHNNGIVRDFAKDILSENISTEIAEYVVGKIKDKNEDFMIKENILRILKTVILKLNESTIKNKKVIDIIIEPLMDLAINSKNSNNRRWASFALCEYKLQDRIERIVTPICKQILTNPCPKARENAILALHYPILDEAAYAIIDALDDKNTQVCNYAIHRLKYISFDSNEKRNVANKLFLIIKNSNKKIIPSALNSFANLKNSLNDDEIKYIVYLLENSDINIRFRAAEALGIHKVEEAKEYLIKMINAEKNEDSWSMAIWAVLNIDMHFYETVKKNSWEETYFELLLSKSDTEDRRFAVDVLARIGGERSLKFLINYQQELRNKNPGEIPTNIYPSISKLEDRLKIRVNDKFAF